MNDYTVEQINALAFEYYDAKCQNQPLYKIREKLWEALYAKLLSRFKYINEETLDIFNNMFVAKSDNANNVLDLWIPEDNSNFFAYFWNRFGFQNKRFHTEQSKYRKNVSNDTDLTRENDQGDQITPLNKSSKDDEKNSYDFNTPPDKKGGLYDIDIAANMVNLMINHVAFYNRKNETSVKYNYNRLYFTEMSHLILHFFAEKLSMKHPLMARLNEPLFHEIHINFADYIFVIKCRDIVALAETDEVFDSPVPLKVFSNFATTETTKQITEQAISQSHTKYNHSLREKFMEAGFVITLPQKDN